MDEQDRNGIELWEFALIRKIASRYAGQVDADELASELCLHVLKLKHRKSELIVDWKAYLAKSLLRRADRIVPSWIRRQGRAVSLDTAIAAPAEHMRDIRLEELLSTDDQDGTSFDELISMYQGLGPKEKRLWDLLVEERGNTLRVAKRMRKPRKTVDYHIQKLRRLIKSRGFGV